MRDEILWQDEEFDQVPTEKLLIKLDDVSRIVRARALATLARRSKQDETLINYILEAITDSVNMDSRLIGSTISVSHVGFAGLWEFGTPIAKKSLKNLLQGWAEPDRTDLLWFLKSQAISDEVGVASVNP